MKTYKILAALFVLVLSLASCSEDRLELENPNTLATEQFWKSPADAELGVNAVYDMFYKEGGWARWMYFRTDLTSDEGFSASPWIELADWTRFNYINYNFWEGNVNSYRDTYKAIFRANQVLANVPDIEFADENRKKEILAEAKFLRALYYYYATILWENIPLVTEPSAPLDQPEQKTEAEIFTFIENDLNEAFADLPASWDNNNVGRPTKGAAKAMLGKVYMQQHKWAQAEDALSYLITGQGAIYSLMPNYEDNFTHYVENNAESVFEIQFSDERRGGTCDCPNSALSLNRSQFFAPRGIGWSDGQARYWLVDEFKREANRDGGIDIRLRYSLFYRDLQADFGDLTYGRGWEWADYETWFRKYQRSYYRTNEDYFSQVNVRMIRYADILLRYAEVLNELNRTNDAYQYVNLVRSRANMNNLQVAHPEIGNDKTKFLNRLKIERSLELAGESVRWADLKRWGDLDSQESVNQIALRDPDFNNFVVGKHHRLPLPPFDVDNNPNLNQNSGY